MSGRTRCLGWRLRGSSRGWLSGAGEVEQVPPLGVVELERPGERFQDALRDPVDVAALEAGVVGDADTG
jgi:hypothetical protein